MKIIQIIEVNFNPIETVRATMLGLGDDGEIYEAWVSKDSTKYTWEKWLQ